MMQTTAALAILAVAYNTLAASVAITIIAYICVLIIDLSSTDHTSWHKQPSKCFLYIIYQSTNTKHSIIN